MKIKFSIGLPAYKSKFMYECVKSILDQTYDNFELIILNDKSPEDVKSIVNRFNDSRMIYLENEHNIGSENLILNWNKCLELSTGDYFIMMGDDDTMQTDYLEEFTRLIEKYPDLDVYHCRSNIIDDKGEVKLLTPSWPEFETVYDNIWHRITEKRAQYISDFVYRSSALKAQGGFFNSPLAWGSDDITSFISMGAKGIAHTNRPVFNYRSHDTSITSTGKIALKLKANQIYYLWLESFLNKGIIDPRGKVMYEELKRNFKVYLRKRNVQALVKAMGGKTKSAISLLSEFKKHNMPFSDVMFVLLNSFRRRIVK